MPKKLLPLHFLFFISTILSAQDKPKTETTKLSLGFNVGLNASNIIAERNDTLFSEDYHTRAGFLFGPLLFYRLHPLFELRAGVNISILGFKEVDTLFNNTIDRVLIKTYSNLSYITLPIGIKGTFIPDFNGSFFYEFGAYASYLLQANTATDVDKNEASNVRVKVEEYSYKIGSSQEDDLLPFDFGARIGIGLNFNMVDLGLSYNWGLQNIASDTRNNASIHNRFFQFYLVFKVPLLKS